MEKTFYVPTAKYLENLVTKDLESFGITPDKVFPTGILFTAPPEKAIHWGLTTRLTSRLLLKLDSGVVEKEKDLYHALRQFPWKEWISLDETFKIQTSMSGDKPFKHFKNSHYLSLLTKDALCDSFMDEEGVRPSVEKFNSDVNFHLHMFLNNKNHKHHYDLYYDLLGNMGMRGYRIESTTAPLRETLAAAIIESSELQGENFLDPMCGSGTLLFELAIKLLDLPGSYLRILNGRINLSPLQRILGNDDALKLLKSLSEDIQDKLQSKSLSLLGEDISGRSIDAFEKNLKASKLSRFIRVKKGDFFKSKPTTSTGTLVFNPPYGKRMGEEEDMESFYFEIGEKLKEDYKGWTAYLFTGSPSLRKKISLQTSKRIPFLNGDIESRLFEYKLF